MNPYAFPPNLSGLRSALAALNSEIDGARFGSPGSVLYVRSATGDDANDGGTWHTALRTLLAAYDRIASGGTIYVADNTLIGGEVPGQGLWLMGSHDPQYNSRPAGWRAVKPLRIVGAGSGSGGFVRHPVSALVGGTTTWARDPDKPAIWVSGNRGISLTFENLAVQHPCRALSLGVPSNRARVDSFAANVTFRYCRFAVSGPATDVDRGPVVEMEHTFWIHFEDCGFGALGMAATTPNEALALTAEERGAAIAAVVRGGASACFSVRRCVASLGGISYTLGSTGAYVDVDDFAIEGDYVSAVQPVVKVNGAAQHLNVLVRNAFQFDASTAGPATVTVRPLTASPESVTCINVDRVDGPATVLARYPSRRTDTSTLAAMGAVGFDGRKVVGEHDAGRRLGAPAVARYSNLLLGPPSTSAAFEVSSGVLDPLGGTGAYRATALLTGRQDLALRSIPATLGVGGRMVLAAWLRAPGGCNGGSEPALLLTSGATGNVFSSGLSYAAAAPSIVGDGQWSWVVAHGTLATVAVPSCTWALSMHSDRTFEIYGLTAHYVPPGAMSGNEWAEWIANLSPAPFGAPAGELLASQRLGMRDSVTGEWRYIRISNGQIVVES